jgi:formate C-acetyltransferase
MSNLGLGTAKKEKTMKACEREEKGMPCGIEPYDKEWNVGYSGMRDDLSPYPRINRMRRHFLNTEFTVSHERACLYTEAYQKNESQPQGIKVAKALAHVMQNVPIRLYPDELIVGEHGSPMKSAPVFPEYSFNWILDEIKNFPWDQRSHDKYYISEESKQRLLELEGYWKGKTVEENILSEMSEDMKKGSDVGKGLFLVNVHLRGAIGHIHLNYPKLFANGFKGIKAQVEKKMATINTALPEDLKKREFYEAELIMLDACMNFIKRYAKLARETAAQEENKTRKREVQHIAENCEWVAENPPRTFWEALQLWYMASMIELIETNSQGNGFGRMDQYLYPYYKKDIEEGRITKEFAQELIEVAYVKSGYPTKIRERQGIEINTGRTIGSESITLGGVGRDGKDATNDLTFMMLDASAHTRMMAPWVAVRFHANTPHELKVKAINVIRIGYGHPKLFNDEPAIPAALAKGGRSLQMARDYAVIGCVEIDQPGYEYGAHDCLYFCIAKVFELAINDGKCLGCGSQCPRWSECGDAGKQLGLRTGSLADFKSFDEVVTAYQKQLKYWMDLAVATVNITEIVHQKLKPLPYTSLLIDDCIEKGLDVSAGGARFNHDGPQANGVATVADGMSAIKQLVFEEKKVSGSDFLKALESNWEGYEPLYALVNSDKVHHYGNDDDYADELAQIAYNSYFDVVEGRPNVRGGTYQPGVYTVSANVAFGLMQWASPDGRKAFEALSDNVGAVHTAAGSHDICGATAFAKSCTKLDHERAGNGTLLNWKFTPSVVSGETGRDNLIHLMDVYFGRKGMQSQFNIVSRKTLEDAMAHPEKYKDMLVRVAGYSAYFVELGKPLQMDIIGRTEMSFD